MTSTYYRTLGELRKSIVGGGDSFHYRGTTGARVSNPQQYAKRRGYVLLVSWSGRLGYVGIARCVNSPEGWHVYDGDGGEFFDQSGEYLGDDGIDVARAVSDYVSTY